jgi:hypothetical protein
MKRYFRMLTDSLWCKHEDILRVHTGRMWMQCLKCGRETDGITVTLGSHKERRLRLSHSSR